MVGGTGKFSEGIFAVESSMQRNWNYGLTKDEAFQKIMNYGHWRGNAKMVRAFVDKSGETIDWMQANGVKFEKLFSNYPNGLYTWHIYEGRGAGWINLFQQKYKDAGQTLLLNTWGKELIQDKNGTVKGVVATNKNGDKITVNTVDNLGYGYMGISSVAVNVGGDPGSKASKDLRKGLATVFAAYRELSVESYYGERASVINYPISNTSWAAPQATDAGYQVAFSVDVDGKPIYTSGMSADDKYAAAKTAALGFFQAAGYTVENGKITAAPEGAKMQYEVQIPADGTGNHPSFMMVTEAKKALAEIGMDIVVTDLSDSTALWDGIRARQVDMWCAAWNATVDPDMYQIYYADVADFNGDMGNGYNPMGGPDQGNSSYMYCVADEELDNMILEARKSLDQSYRKTLYKACLDTIVDWATEVPVYQRQNAIIFSTERVNIDTVTPDITTFYGWMSEIQNMELK